MRRERVVMRSRTLSPVSRIERNQTFRAGVAVDAPRARSLPRSGSGFEAVFDSVASLRRG